MTGPKPHAGIPVCEISSMVVFDSEQACSKRDTLLGSSIKKSTVTTTLKSYAHCVFTFGFGPCAVTVLVIHQ